MQKSLFMFVLASVCVYFVLDEIYGQKRVSKLTVALLGESAYQKVIPTPDNPADPNNKENILNGTRPNYAVPPKK